MKTTILFFFLLFFVACSENKELTELDKIKTFYINNTPKKGKAFDNYNYIVIINEIGDCINCNNAFSKKVENAVEKQNVLFILSGNGTRVDISGFIDEEYPNVIWDQTAKFNALHIVDKCAVLELSNDSVVSTTLMNIDNINDYQLPF